MSFPQNIDLNFGNPYSTSPGNAQTSGFSLPGGTYSRGSEEYFPGYPDVAPIKPTKEDIRGYYYEVEKDSQLDAMDTELEADIVGTILEKIPGAYVTSADTESKVISL